MGNELVGVLEKINMELPKTDMEYKKALIDAAHLGAIKALEEAGLLKPYIKLAEAKRKYGTYYVYQWIKKGHIKPIKEGKRNSTVWLKRSELEAAASNQIINALRTNTL